MSLNSNRSRSDQPEVTLEGQCQHSTHCPLNCVKAGTAVRIKQLSASPEVNHRLREMGFCEEKFIKLLSRQHNVICQVCNARLGLSAELAGKILVELVPAAGGY